MKLPLLLIFANAVGFLCRPASRFITGQMLHVNGGEYLP